MTAIAAPEPVTDAEVLDATCIAMIPAARQLIGAVRSRNPEAVSAALDAAYGLDLPAGRGATYSLTVLALVLADEVILAEAAPVAVRAERERCRRLAVGVIHSTTGDVVSRARRLPALIAQGARA